MGSFTPISEEEFQKSGEKGEPFKPADNPDDFESPAARPGVSEWQSRKIGALQSGTFNFADELEAAFKAATGPQKYRDVWNDLQKEIEDAQKNKGAYLQGEIAGGVASSFIPGLGLGGNILRGAKTLNAARSALPLLARMKDAAAVGAKLGAIQGGISGLGGGGELRLGTVGDIGLGAAGGALAGVVTGAAMEPISDWIRPAVIMAKEKIAQPLMRTLAPFFKVPQKVAAEVSREPHLYQGPKRELEEVAKDATAKLNQFSEAASVDKAEAMAALTDDAAVSAKEVLNTLRETAEEMEMTYRGKVTKTIQTPEGPQKVVKIQTDSDIPGAMDIIKRQQKKIRSMADENGMISQKNLRQIIKSFDRNAHFNAEIHPENIKPIALTFQRARGKLNEKLKSLNSDYAEAIERSQEKTGLLEQAADALKVGKADPHAVISVDEPGRYMTKDATVSMLKNIRNKPISAEVIGGLAEKFPGTDFAGAARAITNEAALGFQQPSLQSLGWTAITGGMGAPMVARDIAGPRIWRNMVLGVADPLTEGTFENFLRRSLVTPAAAAVQGGLNPYQPKTEFEFPEESITPRK